MREWIFAREATSLIQRPCPSNGTQGELTAFFKHPTNYLVAKEGFKLMAQAMAKYDKDYSRQLDMAELTDFFTHEMPRAMSTGTRALCARMRGL